jgi:hypothetical protein
MRTRGLSATTEPLQDDPSSRWPRRGITQRREFVASQATGEHDVGTNEDWPVIRGEPVINRPTREFRRRRVQAARGVHILALCRAAITTRPSWQAFADTEPHISHGPAHVAQRGRDRALNRLSSLAVRASELHLAMPFPIVRSDAVPRSLEQATGDNGLRTPMRRTCDLCAAN